MRGMIKIDEFVIPETNVKVVILGDKETGGKSFAMATMIPPKGYIMTLDRGCILDPALNEV